MEGLLELRAGVKQLIGKGWVEKDDLWGPLEMKGGLLMVFSCKART